MNIQIKKYILNETPVFICKIDNGKEWQSFVFDEKTTDEEYKNGSDKLTHFLNEQTSS